MTERFVLIGHPVGHSVSPQIHQAAYALLGKRGDYRLCDCSTQDDVRAQIELIRSGHLVGANVTVPWKQLAYDLADERAASAQEVGVANVLAQNKAGQVVAHNTDATALADELRLISEQCPHRKLRPGVLIVGNGGAARAAVVACRLSGLGPIAVTARSFCEGPGPSAWPRGGEFQALGAQLVGWPEPQNAACESFVSAAHLIVQATSAGMKGTSGGKQLAELLPWAALREGAAYDLVYNPPVTPFLERARAEKHIARGGLGMLVGQAAHALELWWGQRPAQGPLLLAAQKALGL